MSTHIFREEDIVPDNKTINIRGILDHGGPHMLCMGTRTTQADGAATGAIILACHYEDPSGNVQTFSTGGYSDLSTTDPIVGSTWYMKDSLIMDKYYPAGDGPGLDPYGYFVLELALTGNPGTALYSYEAVLEIFDGSPAVVYHP